MRKVCQIKGANGSGKTTIGRQLAGLSSNLEYARNSEICNTANRPFATLLHDLKWAMVGPYYPNVYRSGWDSLGTRRMDELFAVVDYLVKNYSDYWLYIEGAMIGTTMTTYRHILEIGESPIIVILNTTMIGSLRRLEYRKGVSNLTPAMFTQLEQKLDRIPKQKHQPEHVRQMYVDRLEESEMVYEFLSVVDWHPQP